MKTQVKQHLREGKIVKQHQRSNKKKSVSFGDFSVSNETFELKKNKKKKLNKFNPAKDRKFDFKSFS